MERAQRVGNVYVPSPISGYRVVFPDAQSDACQKYVSEVTRKMKKDCRSSDPGAELAL